jgi:hypothetical protein
VRICALHRPLARRTTRVPDVGVRHIGHSVTSTHSRRWPASGPPAKMWLLACLLTILWFFFLRIIVSIYDRISRLTERIILLEYDVHNKPVVGVPVRL